MIANMENFAIKQGKSHIEPFWAYTGTNDCCISISFIVTFLNLGLSYAEQLNNMCRILPNSTQYYE